MRSRKDTASEASSALATGPPTCEVSDTKASRDSDPDPDPEYVYLSGFLRYLSECLEIELNTAAASSSKWDLAAMHLLAARCTAFQSIQTEAEEAFGELKSAHGDALTAEDEELFDRIIVTTKQRVQTLRDDWVGLVETCFRVDSKRKSVESVWKTETEAGESYRKCLRELYARQVDKDARKGAVDA